MSGSVRVPRHPLEQEVTSSSPFPAAGRTRGRGFFEGPECEEQTFAVHAVDDVLLVEEHRTTMAGSRAGRPSIAYSHDAGLKN
jgi:hypothetical protein